MLSKNVEDVPTSNKLWLRYLLNKIPNLHSKSKKKKYGVKLPNFYDLQNMINVGILKSISKQLRIIHS